MEEAFGSTESRLKNGECNAKNIKRIIPQKTPM